MAMKKRTKKILVIGGVVVGVLFLVPVVMNYLRPTGTVHPDLPQAGPSQVPLSAGRSMFQAKAYHDPVPIPWPVLGILG